MYYIHYIFSDRFSAKILQQNPENISRFATIDFEFLNRFLLNLAILKSLLSKSLKFCKIENSEKKSVNFIFEENLQNLPSPLKSSDNKNGVENARN